MSGPPVASCMERNRTSPVATEIAPPSDMMAQLEDTELSQVMDVFNSKLRAAQAESRDSETSLPTLRPEQSYSILDVVRSILQTNESESIDEATIFDKYLDVLPLAECLVQQLSEELGLAHLIPHTAQEPIEELSSRSDLSLAQFQRSEGLLKLDLAIYWNSRDLKLGTNCCSRELELQSRLSFLLLYRGRHLKRPGDVEKAIEHGKQTINLASNYHPDMPIHLQIIGYSYALLFEILGRFEYIQSAAAYLEEAVKLTVNDDPECKFRRLSDLASCYHPDITCRGAPEYIQSAVNCFSDAAMLASESHPQKPGYIFYLGSSYRLLFERLGHFEHLQSATECFGQAAVLTPPDHSDRLCILNNLGTSYLQQFAVYDSLETLQKAVVNVQLAADLISDDTPCATISSIISNLVVCHLALYKRLGQLQYLHSAIEHFDKIANLAPDMLKCQPQCLYALGSAYFDLFQRLGEIEVLHKAMSYFDKADKLMSSSDPTKPVYLCIRGLAYQQLFHSLGQLQDLHNAVDYLEHAVKLTPDDDPAKSPRLSVLGNAYRALSNHMGNSDGLQKATNYYRDAILLTPEDYPEMPEYLAGLGSAYNSLFRQHPENEYIHTAADCYEKAVKLTPEDDPHQPQLLFSLGIVYTSLYLNSNHKADLHKAKNAFQRAALSPLGLPGTRLSAARMWTKAAITEGCNPLEAFAQCMMLLPKAVWTGTSIHRRYNRLNSSDTRDLITRASATAILMGQNHLAIEWLEQGRCLVWSQMLELRTPLDNLRASHPELATQLTHLSRQLENTVSSGLEIQLTSQLEGSWHNVANMSSKLADERDGLIDRIRLLPGFDDFFRPRLASKLFNHVRHGVAVILNVDRLRCDALIIDSSTQAITNTPLTTFSYEMAVNASAQLNCCLYTRETCRRVVYGDDEYHMSFVGMLSMLWYNVVKPVLTHLNLSQILPIDELPHITWCITGPLSFLPIHAAGDYEAGPESILSNLAVSSYTPNITSMGRTTLNHSSFSGILAVGHQLSIRGLTALPGTKAELDQVGEKCAGLKCTRLEDEAACTEAVLQAMANHSWVHFACHASQDPKDPLKSALHLHDGDLDLATISRHPMKHAQLAFLSACETATGYSVLPDEAVHLAAGLLMSGFPNVIATMWSICDADAPIVAGKFYESLLEKGVPDDCKAALAIHKAVRCLRDTIGIEKFERWVPYIHLGG